MSVQRCKRETTSTEFVKWRVKLNRDTNKFDPLHHYFAQLTKEVRLANQGLKPAQRRKKTEDFLLKFELRGGEKPKPLTKQEATERSRSFWFALLRAKAQGTSIDVSKLGT